MNPNLDRLQPYPFERLRALLSDVEPPADTRPINLAIGEPKHETPEFIRTALADTLADGINRYPPTRGTAALRESIRDWLAWRYDLDRQGLDIDRHILPVAGTREALFAIAQAVIDADREPIVAMPNPFYQIYEGAALVAGADPLYLNDVSWMDHVPDIDSVTAEQWRRCQLVYLCSPANPSGDVLSASWLTRLIALADQYDFVIASDECYSELYPHGGEPPPGLLSACRDLGRDDYHRCLVFHSLSKRSSAPGLRSGFVAGDPAILERFFSYRTYHGCAMPLHTQAASEAAWRDEEHVRDNRRRYSEKFEAVTDALAPRLYLSAPEGGFYLWPDIGGDDETFARECYQHTGVTVLPGSYLSRHTADGNPGAGRVRIALVADQDECVEAAQRLRGFLG